MDYEFWIIILLVVLIAVIFWAILNQAGIERQIAGVHLQLNSRLDQLSKALLAVEFIKGHEAGVEEEKARHQENP